MEFEHLIPMAAGGRTVEENLWLSCRRCNEFKGLQTKAADTETSEMVALFLIHASRVGTSVSAGTKTERRLSA